MINIGGWFYPERPTPDEEERYFLREMMQEIINRADNPEPGTSKVQDMKKIAQRALDRKFFEDVRGGA